jgi:Dolichyl-phosphate-mannose-protein mannosyltransferase
MRRTTPSTSRDVVLPDANATATMRSSKTVERWSILAALVIAGAYLASSLYIASNRLFWFDELFTIHIARVSDWTTIWTALRNGADSLPPTYYVLVRALGNVLGKGEVATRVPSAVAMTAGLLLTFDCARRLTDALHGLIALMLLACSFLPYYGIEARSYAIYFMLAALALWIWVSTKAQSNGAAIWFGAVLFLGVCMHYYAVMILAPYALWELIHWSPGQRPSKKLMAGAVGVVLPAVILSPFVLSFSRKFGGGFWNRPSLNELRDIFVQFFPAGLFLLALIMIWIVLADNRKQAIVLPPMQSAEALGWLFLSVPVIGFVLAELMTNAFFSRYFLCVLPGVAVAFSCLLWRHFGNCYRVSLGVFLILATVGFSKQLSVTQHPELVGPTGTVEYLGMEPSLRAEGKRFFVISPPLLFLSAEFYSGHPEACILLLPPDLNNPAGGAQSSPDPYLHQRLIMNLSQYHPFELWQIDDLKLHARETALIEPSSEILEVLKRAGIKIEVRSAKPLRIFYLE